MSTAFSKTNSLCLGRRPDPGPLARRLDHVPLRRETFALFPELFTPHQVHSQAKRLAGKFEWSPCRISVNSIAGRDKSSKCIVNIEERPCSSLFMSNGYFHQRGTKWLDAGTAGATRTISRLNRSFSASRRAIRSNKAGFSGSTSGVAKANKASYWPIPSITASPTAGAG